MRLVLVRHGRPEECDALRPHDPGLHAEGWRQAHAVADLLARDGPAHLVCSPLLRARQTAQPLAQLRGLPLHTIDGWAEADRRASHYRSTETLRALGDTEWARFLDDPVGYLGGQDDVFRSQVLQALQATIALADSGTVVVFTHGLPINVVLSHALGLEKLVHFQPGYGPVSRLSVKGAPRRTGIYSINEHGHPQLPAADLRPTYHE